MHIKTSISIVTLMLLSSLFISFTASAAPSKYIEENADTIMSNDNIITGVITDLSKKSIEVDHFSQKICSNVLIFTPGNQIISVDELDTAEEVRLFMNSGCVRKIQVLRVAQ